MVTPLYIQTPYVKKINKYEKAAKIIVDTHGHLVEMLSLILKSEWPIHRGLGYLQTD